MAPRTKSLQYLNDRPELVVECIENYSDNSRCYQRTSYRITSLNSLDNKKIRALREVGVIGYGQSCMIGHKNLDGKIEFHNESVLGQPSGFDTVKCSVVVDGKVVDEPPINQYTGSPLEPIQVPYYVYVVTNTVDSSD